MNTQKPLIPLKAINFEDTARAVEDFAKENNVPSLTFPKGAAKEGERASAEAKAPEAIRPKVVMKRLPMVVPEYVIDSLKHRAAQNKGASVRFVVLSALKAYGIEVRDDELVKDKRRET